MDNRELIIPTRFDHKDAVAGLKAIEQCGHVADGLEQAADAASARFRKAHESINSASQGYLDLRRALQGVADHESRPIAGGHVANEARLGGATDLTPRKWSESAGEFRGHPGARFGSPGMNPTGEGSDEDRRELAPPSNMLGDPPHRAAEPSPGQAPYTASGRPAGPGHEASASEMAFRATAEATSRGFDGESSRLMDGTSRYRQAGTLAEGPRADGVRGDGLGTFLENKESLADSSARRAAEQGPAYPGVEPRESGWLGRPAREASANFAGWANGDSEGSKDGLAATRSARKTTADGPLLHDLQGVRDEAEARLKNESISEGLDAREGIRRMRTSFAATGPADGQLTDERTAGFRAGAGVSPGGRDPNVQLGGATAGGTIERLLREQNELLRQDLQRNASPPIAAPPPMRGGGIRMGS